MKQNTKKGGIFYSAFNIVNIVGNHDIMKRKFGKLFAIPAYNSFI